MDKIHIRDLKLETIIGIFNWEREVKQEILINIELFCKLRKAGLSDDLNDTVDYKTLKQKIIKLVENSEYKLIEALAENIASLCLEDEKIEKVRIVVDKPSALHCARSVAVEIERP